MLKVRVVVIFTRTNSCVKGQSSCDLLQGLTPVLKVRVAVILTRTKSVLKVRVDVGLTSVLKERVVVIFTRTNTCVKGESSCDLYKD